jgi:hypothetical protein
VIPFFAEPLDLRIAIDPAEAQSADLAGEAVVEEDVNCLMECAVLGG